MQLFIDFFPGSLSSALFKAVVSVEAALCESFGEDPILDARGFVRRKFGWNFSVNWMESFASEKFVCCVVFFADD